MGSAVNPRSLDGEWIAMHLVSAKIGPFKSIEKPAAVKIEEGVTVLVGMNEAGKTVFLEALLKSDDIFDRAKFAYIDDYPRKDLSTYERRHGTNPDTVTALTYQLTDKEVAAINKTLHTLLPNNFQFTVRHSYQNYATISLAVNDKSVITELSKGAISTDFRDAISKVPSFAEIPGAVASLSLTDPDKQFLAAINQRIEAATKARWGADVVGYEVWQQLNSRQNSCTLVITKSCPAK